ncbi:MAG: thiamine pyrophosphate-dependent enzyme [Gemmatimonadales bacterium]
MTATAPAPLKPSDFESDQEVRWCPGCGDYAILKAVQRTLADIGAKTETTVFVSGIGCSSRFPYYISTYGFHTIHGRAPAVATGLKLANPDLDVWLVTGDGDGLSIGGNHLLHILRRNVDLTIMLFNNEIYGLTKGQYSPTSRVGTRSPSTPLGSLDMPLSPTLFALGAGAHFVARSVDTQVAHLITTLKRAHAHRGTSFVEIFQNCVVYNDGVFDEFTERSVAAERQLLAEHGKPLLFGKERKQGLRLRTEALELEVVTIGENGVTEADILVHDETNRTLANWLGSLHPPAFPQVLGVLYCSPAPTYESVVFDQMRASAGKGPQDMNALMRTGRTWTVAG